MISHEQFFGDSTSIIKSCMSLSLKALSRQELAQITRNFPIFVILHCGSNVICPHLYC